MMLVTELISPTIPREYVLSLLFNRYAFPSCATDARRRAAELNDAARRERERRDREHNARLAQLDRDAAAIGREPHRADRPARASGALNVFSIYEARRERVSSARESEPR
jgi:hypothetical protein